MIFHSKPQGFVTIAVSRNSQEQEFIMHKELVTFHSPFFDRAFNSRFIEGLTQRMTMDDVSAKVFGLLVHWLYTQNIEEAPIVDLVNLWILAERCLMPILQNQVMDEIRSLLRQGVYDDVTSTKMVLELLFNDNVRSAFPSLENMLLDFFAFGPSAVLQGYMVHFPRGFLISVTALLSKHHDGLVKKLKGNANKHDSDYHVEVIDEQTKRAKKSGG